MRRRIRLAGICAVCALLGIASSGASQQPFGSGVNLRTRTHIGIGYAINAPQQLLGFSGFVLGPALGGWGFYADVKFTLDSPRDRDGFEPDITVAEAEGFEDRWVEADGAWTNVNAAAVRVLTDALAIYAGAGYSKEKSFLRYFDGTSERGRFGNYWIDDPDDSGNGVNLLGGAWFRATSRIMFQFGVESAPPGVTVGAAFLLPIGG